MHSHVLPKKPGNKLLTDESHNKSRHRHARFLERKQDSQPATGINQQMVSKAYKRLLFVAIIFPFTAMWLCAFSSFALDWELINFRVKKILQATCPKREKLTGLHLDLQIKEILLHSGLRLPTGKTDLCEQEGFEINLEEFSELTMLRGIVNASARSLGSPSWKVYNMKSGVFSVCNMLSKVNGLKADADNNASSLGEEGHGCFNYLTDVSKSKSALCRLMLIRMQNNLISCIIVVLMCTGSSAVIGIISVVFRIVPAALVNAYLYLTAGLFVIFANCIQHIKINKIQLNWGPCYPVAILPHELYDPQFVRVSIGWPVYVSWFSVVVYFAASCSWFMFKRILNFEASKTII